MGVLGSWIISEPPWTLLLTDDQALTNVSRSEIEEQLGRWREVLEGSGLKISRKKTAYMGLDRVQLQGESLSEEKNFKHLATKVNMPNSLDPLVTARIQGVWEYKGEPAYYRSVQRGSSTFLIVRRGNLHANQSVCPKVGGQEDEDVAMWRRWRTPVETMRVQDMVLQRRKQ